MARGTSKCLFLFLLFILIVCCSGTLVGFFYDARKNSGILSPTETKSFLKLNEVSPSQVRVFVAEHRVLDHLSNTNVYVDLYLNETLAENLRNYIPWAISWLKTNLITSLPHVHIKSIKVSSSSNDLPGENEFPVLLSTLKSINSIIDTFHHDMDMKLSVALPLSSLKNLNRKQEKDLHKICDFVIKACSCISIEARIDGELSMGDKFIELVTESVTLAASVLPRDVSMVLTIKSSAIPSAIELAEFDNKISRWLNNNPQVLGKVIELFAEVTSIKGFEQKELKREEKLVFHLSQRQLLDNFHFTTTEHDSIDPPITIFPTTPITNPVTTPAIVPPDYSAPTVVTVPSTYPITATPTPASTPLTVPSTTTPVPVPYTNPGNTPVPVTNPVTTPSTNPVTQPVNSPVTTYPPTGGVPVTTPVTNPVTPPATTNSPAIPGQSWCVAKSGILETSLQAALDYACGIGGADCSTIQQGGGCYNPNTVQNHASYAFNSYFEKNPSQSSCDFGGTAMITNINPSSGSCIYPTSSSSSSSSSSPTSPTPTTTSSSGAGVPSSGTPPTVVNTSNPASSTTTVFGDTPPSVNTSTSKSSGLQPFISSVIMVSSIITEALILNM